jgi:hypothetical protein
MNRIHLLALHALTIGSALLAGPAASAAGLTYSEQAALLQSTGHSGYQATSAMRTGAQLDLVTEIERTIQRANRGNAAASLHRPVSRTALKGLQQRLALRGKPVPLWRLEPMVDYSQALMRESVGNASLSEKVARLPSQLRKPFHGNVAEFAEARARGMVLTRNRTATTWDLTEGRFQPQRNFQVKILARNSKALSSLVDDLAARTSYVKRGITTQRTLDWGLRNSKLVRNGNVYSPVNRPDIQLEASKVFSRPGLSQRYARAGRASLIQADRVSGTRAQTSDVRFQSASKWMGRLGIAAVLATEVYAVHGYYTGRMSRREFVSINSGLAGSLAGGAAGAYVGAWAGPAGIAVGGVVGAVLGYQGGQMVADSYYARLNEQQKLQLEAFIYRHYGVTPQDEVGGPSG